MYKNQSSRRNRSRRFDEKVFEGKNQLLIWFEIVSKYGAFGEYEPKYKPSFKDFRIAI